MSNLCYLYIHCSMVKFSVFVAPKIEQSPCPSSFPREAISCGALHFRILIMVVQSSLPQLPVWIGYFGGWCVGGECQPSVSLIPSYNSVVIQTAKETFLPLAAGGSRSHEHHHGPWWDHRLQPLL